MKVKIHNGKYNDTIMFDIEELTEETTSCEWCNGEVLKYFDVNWCDFVNGKRGSVNYCPNCGRRLED